MVFVLYISVGSRISYPSLDCVLCGFVLGVVVQAKKRKNIRVGLAVLQDLESFEN